MASTTEHSAGPAGQVAKASLFYDPKIRGLFYQVLLLSLVAFLVYGAASNAVENMRSQNIATGFGFLSVTSGFDVNQTLIPYSATSTYGRAFLVGLLNTLLVSAIGIVFATFLGFTVGVARLSKNWLVSTVAMVYVELIRNLPLLLQLYFWYNAVLKAMPAPRQSWTLPGLTFGFGNLVPLMLMLVICALGYVFIRSSRSKIADDSLQALAAAGAIVATIAALYFIGAFVGWPLGTLEQGIAFVNNRGLTVPRAVFGDGAGLIGIAFIVSIVGALVFRSWAKKQQERTGEQYPIGLVAFAAIIGLPLIAYLVAGRPVSFELPVLRGFNFQGGIQIYPEFIALLLGLSTYTAGFIAEIVRAGILAVSKGQTEAANALGLRASPTLKLVVIPQAMRVIIPPLTSQYLNLTKNSSLAVAIGYPDLVQVFTGTVLNQTGQAVEVVAITMAVYLTISLVTSFVMNIYNQRVALVER